MTSEQETAAGGFRASRRLAFLSILAVAAFGVLMTANVVLYAADTLARTAALVIGDRTRVPLHVDARLQSIDYNRGEMSVRLDPRPSGALLAADGLSLAQPLRAVTNGVADRGEIVWPAGKPPAPIEVKLELFGLVSDYPFDVHEGTWVLSFTSTDSNGAVSSVPFSLAFLGTLPGAQVTTTQSETGPSDLVVDLDLTVSRATSSIYFSLLVMAIMWALAITILVQSFLLAFRGRKIEPTMFGYMGAMIFAFPTLRNSMPGAPPIGVLADYLAFFWAEAIVAVAMLLGLLAWIFRPYK